VCVEPAMCALDIDCQGWRVCDAVSGQCVEGACSGAIPLPLGVPTIGQVVAAMPRFFVACDPPNLGFAPETLYVIELAMPSTGQITVDGFDAFVYVIDAGCDPFGGAVACGPDAGLGPVELPAGVSYVVVEGEGGDTGMFTITAAVVP